MHKLLIAENSLQYNVTTIDLKAVFTWPMQVANHKVDGRARPAGLAGTTSVRLISRRGGCTDSSCQHVEVIPLKKQKETSRQYRNTHSLARINSRKQDNNCVT